MLLEGRRAVITGASSGIGKATALRLAREGASVAVNFFSDREATHAQAVVAECAKNPGVRAIAVQADVGSEDDVVRMTAQAKEAFGGIDILVNNAGIENQVPTLDMPLKDWERVLRTNLTGAFLCLRECGKVMRDGGGGVIVNMSSVHEFIPWPGFAHYCASKGGIKLLMQTAARELAEAGTNIRVVNIAPGAIATPINDFVLNDPTARHSVEAEIPVGRFGQPDEVAAAVAWVCSAEAAYVTGTTLVVDGGMSTYPRFI
ncbi:MAG: glucose 1-dehydrogenase [Chloroflexota bacterium]|nr:glucose 1-dehydrogenase [Chloroflexota bacterium]